MIYEYPFTSNYINIDGHRLHYVDEGAGPVILMVHGNPTWSYYYRNLVRQLSPNFRVIVPDHIGCGFSDKPQEYEYTLERHIENLTELVQQLELKEISFVLHDWGGAIGMGYATRNCENIKKIVVLNTAAFRSEKIPLRIRICRWPVIGKLIVQGLNGFAWPAKYMAVKRKMKSEIANAYLFPYNNWKNRIAIYRFVCDIPMGPEHGSYECLVKIETGLEKIRAAKIPMLICWGGKDFCFNDVFYQEWKTRFPRAQSRYFGDAGHYVLEDAKGEIEHEISEFLRNYES